MHRSGDAVDQMLDARHLNDRADSKNTMANTRGVALLFLVKGFPIHFRWKLANADSR